MQIKTKTKWLQEKKEIQFTCSIYDKQAFYCPPENDEQRNKINKANEIYYRKRNRIGDEISDNCLFKKKKSKKMTTRFPQCQEPPQPKTMKVYRMKATSETSSNNKNTSNNLELATCGPSDAGQSLLFGYEVMYTKL